jgi:hypothetical protein
VSLQLKLQNVMPVSKRRQSPELHSVPVWQKRH